MEEFTFNTVNQYSQDSEKKKKQLMTKKRKLLLREIRRKKEIIFSETESLEFMFKNGWKNSIREIIQIKNINSHNGKNA